MQLRQGRLDPVAGLLPRLLRCRGQVAPHGLLALAQRAAPAVAHRAGHAAREAALAALGAVVVVGLDLHALRVEQHADGIDQAVLRDQVVDDGLGRLALAVVARGAERQREHQRVGLGIRARRRAGGLRAQAIEHALRGGAQRGVGAVEVDRSFELALREVPRGRRAAVLHRLREAARREGLPPHLGREADRRAGGQPRRRVGAAGRIGSGGQHDCCVGGAGRSLGAELACDLLGVLARRGGGAPAGEQALVLEPLEGQRSGLFAHAVLALEHRGRQRVGGLELVGFELRAHRLEGAVGLRVDAFGGSRDFLRRRRRFGRRRGCRCARFRLGCRRLGLRLRLGLADGRTGVHADFAVALACLLVHQLGQRGRGLGGVGERLGLALARGADAAPADVEFGVCLFDLPEFAGGSFDQFKTAHEKDVLL